MGEEVKKPEEKKVDEKKVEGEKKTEEKKVEEKKPAEAEPKKPEEAKKEEKKDEKEAKEETPPPPPEEVVLRVYMHCEGCAKKVKKCLRGFDGVEDVQTDCKNHKVVVKGKKAAADPLKVLERVQKKSHRKVELLSPIPKPPAEEEPKKPEQEKENVKPAEEKKEEPQVIVVVIKVHMHCEACALEIQKRIQRMKGVQSADPDLKSSQVTVKGVFEPQKLVEYVYKRTGKHAVIVKTEPEKKKEEEKGKEEQKEEEEKKEEEKGKEGGGDKGKTGEEGKTGGGGEEGTKLELMKNEFYYYYPQPKYHMEYAYPPQIFSDENPNACSVM